MTSPPEDPRLTGSDGSVSRRELLKQGAAAAVGGASFLSRLLVEPDGRLRGVGRLRRTFDLMPDGKTFVMLFRGPSTVGMIPDRTTLLQAP